MTELPKYVKVEHLEFLDALRESGGTNMFKAVPYILREFPETGELRASKILSYWMKTWGDRHPKRRRTMFPLTLDLDKNLQQLTVELSSLGSIHEPIEIKVSCGDINYRLTSIGRAHFEGVREVGPTGELITDDEMNNMMKWAVISLAGALKFRGSVDVTGLTEIEKGSRYERAKVVK